MDDNVYTNLMAQRNLACAADWRSTLPDAADKLGVTTEEAASWRDAAAAMHIPYDERLGVHQQCEGFTTYAGGTSRTLPRTTTRCCCTTRTSSCTASRSSSRPTWCWRCTCAADAFTPEEKARNVDYYERRTVRDSSLSACTQAVIAAEVGHLDLAHDYLAEAALIDLRDLHHNTRDGVHMASLAGAWIALVAGFGGMRAGAGSLVVHPAPARRDHRAEVPPSLPGSQAARDDDLRHAKYELLDGEPLPVVQHGKEFELGKKTVERHIPPVTAGPRPEQPPGRAPYNRAAT